MYPGATINPIGESSRLPTFVGCPGRMLSMSSKILTKALWGSLLCAGLAFGDPSSCPTATADSNVSNGVATTSQLIPGAGPGDDLNTLNAGCTGVDLIYSNFGLTAAGGTGLNGAPNGAGTYAVLNPSSADSLLLATVRGTATTSMDGFANDGINNFVDNGSSAPTQDIINYNVTLSSAGTSASTTVLGIVLTAIDPVIQTGAGGLIYLDVCTAGTTAITSVSACTAAHGTYYTQTLILSTATSLGLTLSLPALTNLDVTTVIDLQGNNTPGAGAIAGFDAFSEAFDDSSSVPEPSTFVLIGFALVGIACLCQRRKSA